jgi:DNA-binding response OmpR family regulator
VVGCILIADDDENYRDSLQKVLEKEGYTVVAVGDVDSALTEFDRRPFDLIVCDHRMPGKTGIDLLVELRNRQSRVPFLMISAHADAANHATVVGLGGLDLLAKPVRRRELIDLAAKVVGV